MRQAALIMLLACCIVAGCIDDGGPWEDPWEDDEGAAAAPNHNDNPENCPGGSGGPEPGGGPSGGPGDQPTRKKCSRDQGLDTCLDCCYYNHDWVDGWKCRGIKGDSRRQRAKRKKCWDDAANELGRCQVLDCGRDRPIITITTTGELP